MSQVPEGERAPGWAGRVEFSDEGGGFAYVPNEVLVGGRRGVEEARRLFPSLGADEEEVFPGRETGQFYRMQGEVDPVQVVEELRLEGVVAQPNHVFFAHCAGCCGPHPSMRCGAGLQGSPFYASPFYASGVCPSPFVDRRLRATGRRRSSARPADPPEPAMVAFGAGNRSPRVVVLDTGFATEDQRQDTMTWLQPGQADWERPDEDRNGHLDPAGGHGTYISGLLERCAPGCDLVPRRVLSTMGEGCELAIARAIEAVGPGVDLLNLSFGGYVLERPDALASAVRRVQAAGTVVVASAGNDATCRPSYPAALPGVIGVGALGPGGPAPFTNYGSWVRACAPGVDLVAPFFRQFEGADPAPAGGTDPDNFHGWARWSGTSFAAPVVVAALAREIRRTGVSAEEAVGRVIDAPELLRIPDLGTVVNLA